MEKKEEILCEGGQVVSKGFMIDDSNRKMIFEFLMSLYRTERKHLDERRRLGIQRSSSKGNYKGRSRIKIDKLKLQEIFNEYEGRNMTVEKAAGTVNVSKSTLIRRYREYKKSSQ